ncbi:AAA family ATPase [Vibrio aestuarianus]|uniref:AAA family ATPase n=1 Tax=Vibrio aestuarianus TaxID=28171 RepID=UPI00237CEDE3|nr:AAA family ATPase [Vibrio aestuarianus]MDE1314248.1 AAA family ATPase [Vibrio aestuarianus]
MSINRICNFVNSDEKAGWYRFALRKAIQNGRLASEDLENAYSLARMQFNLESQSDDFEELTKKVESTGFDDETEEHRLVSIAQVKNVSTLAEQQILNFEPREHDLTVIYGNNGAGKSSYAKILKNACLTRGDIPHLKSNVFSTDSGVPAAEIEVLSNGTHETINWNVQSSQHEKLKSIRVFDSSSAHHYLSKTDTLEFKLHELKLTDELLRASTFISEKAKEQEAIYSATPVLPNMHQGTSPSKFIITDKTTENDVSSLCATDQEIKELEDLRKEVIELSSSTPEAIRKRYSKRRVSAP